MVSVSNLHCIQAKWVVEGAIASRYWADFCEIWWQEGRKERRK